MEGQNWCFETASANSKNEKNSLSQKKGFQQVFELVDYWTLQQLEKKPLIKTFHIYVYF